MDSVLTLEEQVAELAVERGLQKLRVYRWRPLGNVELPCIFNWLDASPAEWKSATPPHRRQDAFNLSVRVAVRRGDSDEMTGRLERYADCVRDVIDPAVRQGQPALFAASGVKWADRPGLNMTGEALGEVEALAIAFSLVLQVDRFLTPTA